jgi:hypothetical protein
MDLRSAEPLRGNTGVGAAGVLALGGYLALTGLPHGFAAAFPVTTVAIRPPRSRSCNGGRGKPVAGNYRAAAPGLREPSFTPV